MSKDYYKMLDVEKGASEDEIKKAFRKKAHIYHPDKKTGDEAKFKEINEAYSVLKDKKKRAQYDQFGSDFSNMGAGGGDAGGFGGQGFGGFSGGGVNINMDDMGDIFGDIGEMFGFGGGGGRSRETQSRRGRDMELRISISFKEAVFGVEKEVTVRKNVVCDKCGGNGAEPGTKINTCKTCNGSGKVTRMQRTFLGSMQVQSVCPDCHGEGKTYTQKCSKCGGSGVYVSNEKMNIKIPAGINDGETIKFGGMGEASSKGIAGDLYLRVSVQKSDEFERDEFDIKTEKTINFKQAVLGDKIEINTIHGNINLKIPAGTQSGTIFRLKNKGVKYLQDNRHGNHLVKVIVDIPVKIDRALKKQIEVLDM